MTKLLLDFLISNVNLYSIINSKLNMTRFGYNISEASSCSFNDW